MKINTSKFISEQIKKAFAGKKFVSSQFTSPEDSISYNGKYVCQIKDIIGLKISDAKIYYTHDGYDVLSLVFKEFNGEICFYLDDVIEVKG